MTVHRADFFDAHRRHWEDAEVLFDRHRWANADQLYGFSAECGLKAVMKDLGMLVDTIGAPKIRKHRVHVQDLWPIFKAFVVGRNGALLLSLFPSGSPFADWSHHNRYAHRNHFRERCVRSHREAAWKVRTLVQRAKQGQGP